MIDRLKVFIPKTTVCMFICSFRRTKVTIPFLNIASLLHEAYYQGIYKSL